MWYASVCSGIEAATVAWEPLGWKPAWFAEIDPFCCALLAHRFPTVPNLGDINAITEADLERHGPIDLLVGGTPCQSFSVAGKRGGMADPRGNLAFRFLDLARQTRTQWVVWENVPGVLSIDEGRAFGAFLGRLAELGYGWAYRVLDAQYAGVPQRRRRVFVVGHLGDWRRAVAVLFERHSLSGDPPPRRKTRQGVAALTADGVGTCGADDNQAQAGHLIPFGGDNTTGPIDVATACNAHGGSGRIDFATETFVAHTLRGQGFDASEDGTGRGTPIVPMAFSSKDHAADAGEKAPTLRAMPHDMSHANAGGQVAVCVQESQTGVREYDIAGTIRSNASGTQPGGSCIRQRMAMRCLTPRECERLQGMPDDYTLIPYRGKPARDGPRYKAIGNSMAVPVMRWIGERIAAVEAGTMKLCRRMRHSPRTAPPGRCSD